MRDLKEGQSYRDFLPLTVAYHKRRLHKRPCRNRHQAQYEKDREFPYEITAMSNMTV
jgi:hypothetical protein